MSLLLLQLSQGSVSLTAASYAGPVQPWPGSCLQGKPAGHVQNHKAITVH